MPLRYNSGCDGEVAAEDSQSLPGTMVLFHQGLSHLQATQGDPSVKTSQPCSSHSLLSAERGCDSRRISGLVKAPGSETTYPAAHLGVCAPGQTWQFLPHTSQRCLCGLAVNTQLWAHLVSLGIVPRHHHHHPSPDPWFKIATSHRQMPWWEFQQ